MSSVLVPQAPAVAAGPGATARIAAVVAPLALIGGWTVAAVLQPAGYRHRHPTISDLAAAGARYPAVMTVAFLLTGCALISIARSLRWLAPGARRVVMVGGAAVVVVGLVPVTTLALAHSVAAAVAFIAMAIWPALSLRKGGARPFPVAWVATATVGWTVLLLIVLLAPEMSYVGVFERVLAGTEIVVVSIAAWRGNATKSGTGSQ